jgi:hypothetical protein
MNFIIYNLLLLLGCVLAYIIFTLSKLILLPLGMFKKPQQAVTVLLLGLASLYLIYFSGCWAAFCGAMTYKYTNKPEVTWDWLYFLIGGLWCVSLSRFWVKATIEVNPSEGEQVPVQLQMGVYLFPHIATISSIVAIASYICFAIWPSLMRVPYGWLSILLQ